ncbi:hypothetical protein B0H63DRAFT_408672 [Podospora didyma]|uniref:RING-type domain-containing protein n=1 Tax=Podospora didyma TaxID=330526 RepID=A0AAE0P900_9PEZI|nr:hypothetical protein B0H63DRAFT_408672 [Podospora didyma]
MASSSSSSACKACNEPLILKVSAEESETGEETAVPDDLALSCGCHFHWQCLLDQAAEVTVSLQCPSCGATLASSAQGGAPISTRYINEGGVQEGLDILPALTEEAYLSTNPKARPARALHVMVAEGDVAGIVALLADVDSNPEAGVTSMELLPWTDPLNGGRSALHVAIEAQQQEVFWLLLWLGSKAPVQLFPVTVVEASEEMELKRNVSAIVTDVRTVKDESGRKPSRACYQQGEPWVSYVEGGLFD